MAQGGIAMLKIHQAILMKIEYDIHIHIFSVRFKCVFFYIFSDLSNFHPLPPVIGTSKG